jgi:predicted TIM-barrel fold metal-dependent hydrolase
MDAVSAEAAVASFPSQQHKQQLPAHFVDAHQHFLDPGRNLSFQSFLGSLVGTTTSYLPSDYTRDVVLPLRAAGVTLSGSVHVECLPDDGVAEAAWVQGLYTSPVRATVASCDLAQPLDIVEAQLAALVSTSTKGPAVRGVRWILDADGPFGALNATHVGVTRHDPSSLDYLRGHDNDTTTGIHPGFAAGYARLAAHELSFDLQCAPAQLVAAAALAAQHPGIPVAINHLGKPWNIVLSTNDDDDDDATATAVTLHQTALTEWRTGMHAMAQLPHVYVKLSMLGYAVPGWSRCTARTALVRDLVREVVTLFGAHRCMVALNWWKDAATSDADGRSPVGPSPVEFLQHLSNWFADMTQEDRDRLFEGTARRFYRIPSRVAV